jgi:hypothetical protein
MLLSGMDMTPPVTQTVIISGVPGANDYFRSPVTIDLVASDPNNAPNTLRTFYQVDGRGFHEGEMVTVGDGIHVLQRGSTSTPSPLSSSVTAPKRSTGPGTT